LKETEKRKQEKKQNIKCVCIMIKQTMLGCVAPVRPYKKTNLLAAIYFARLYRQRILQYEVRVFFYFFPLPLSFFDDEKEVKKKEKESSLRSPNNRDVGWKSNKISTHWNGGVLEVSRAGKNLQQNGYAQKGRGARKRGKPPAPPHAISIPSLLVAGKRVCSSFSLGKMIAPRSRVQRREEKEFVAVFFFF
jgi:hypothetical protein